jgi:hypothetical protein
MKFCALSLRKTVLLSKLLADDLQEGIVYRSRKISYCHICCIQTITPGANCDYTHCAFYALSDKRCLVFISIDRIQDHIEFATKDIIGCGVREEFTYDCYLARRINRLYALGKEIGLRLTYRVGQGVHLTVDVCNTHLIKVDQRKLTNTTPRKRFNAPRSNTTKAYDAHGCCAHPSKVFRPQQLIRPAKARIYLFHADSLSHYDPGHPTNPICSSACLLGLRLHL